MTHFDVDTEHPVTIPINGIELEGILHLPSNAAGAVLFVHGSGSGRLSVRNQFVARELNKAKLATLLFDLLTQEEEKIDETTLEFRFDIEFLAERLQKTAEWLRQQPVLDNLNFGYFGASTGGGAALMAAAAKPELVKAVVSRGGRPDLAGEEALSKVKAPVLLIVGGNDPVVIELNQMALKRLHSTKALEIVPGATHLFEEPGTLDIVADQARDWFLKYL